MKTVAIVTMVSSLATLALLIFAGGKTQQIQEEYSQKFKDIASDPLNALLSIVKGNTQPKGE